MADTIAFSQPEGAPGASSDAVEPIDPGPLAPLPHRVAEADGHEIPVADPVGFVDELLERTSVLLATLARDVAGLRAEQAEERTRIEAEHVAQVEALEAATDRLGRLQATARQIAAQKGKADLLESALRLGPGFTVEQADEPHAFDRLVVSLEAEIKAAQGITGAIRLPEIGRLLSDAALVVARMGQVADRTKQRLLARTEDELRAEGTEARASFEIGLGVLRRDLERLDHALGPAGRAWSDPLWASWEPLDGLGELPKCVRLGAYVHPDLPDLAIPALMPVTGWAGVQVEGGGSRAEAIELARGLVLRILTALPPGAARFAFVDPKGLGAEVAPFLALGEYDADLVGGGVLTTGDEIDAHLAGLARHVERITAHHLQGRYASLDDLHRASGEIVEPYRYLVVLDHPTGFGEEAQSLLRAVVESGARAGVMVIVVREGAARPRSRRDQTIPGLLVVKGGPDGLHREVERAGTWRLVVEPTPELAMAESGEPTLFERITTATGALARQARRTPVTPGRVFDLLARAQRKRVRDDLPVTSAPVDPGEPATWWTGDAVPGLGAPLGRTEDRSLASLWFDRSSGGAAIVGPSGRGVSSALQAALASLAVLYSPDELQMLVVGLGERRELAVFGTHRLPHALLVATQAERELGGAVLDAAVRELARREQRFAEAGTERLGLAGHRARTGDQLARLLVVVDGLGELHAVDDAVAAAARRDLRRLAEDGPAFGIHLLLAERVAPTIADDLTVPEGAPADIGTILRFGTDADGLAQPGDATLIAPGAGPVPIRTMWLEPHELAADLRDLRRLADERGLTGGPQVISGDEGAELPRAPLPRLVGDEAEQATRRPLRLWLGEPATMGSPVELQLRRQEGANLLIVSRSAATASGALHAALVSAVIAHGEALETHVVDLGPLDSGFGEAVAVLAAMPSARVQVARRRTAARTIASVGELVATRVAAGDVDALPCLLVVNGLGPARDLAAAADGGDADPTWAAAAEILRMGPEVGVHVLVACESLAQFDDHLGRDTLFEFSTVMVTAVDAEESMTLIDSPYASTLRPNHALLSDEERGRLVKFRPYLLPPRGWRPAAS
ncbi:MAG TPA: FtsK/SpoIIIE domain-containing protein [Acidimicrobiales bacterium]|nr:FtsK/SpoIIIE domain-containing protein [Acidimicrobiales bacterium]